MLSRTTTSTVTIDHPFVVAGYTDEMPPGEYERFIEDEVLQNRSFTADRRTARHLLTEWAVGGSELRPIDHTMLAMTREQDQIDTTNDKNNKNNKNSEAALSPSKDQK